jgi:hypothetical protein
VIPPWAGIRNRLCGFALSGALPMMSQMTELLYRMKPIHASFFSRFLAVFTRFHSHKDFSLLFRFIMVKSGQIYDTCSLEGKCDDKESSAGK